LDEYINMFSPSPITSQAPQSRFGQGKLSPLLWKHFNNSHLGNLDCILIMRYARTFRKVLDFFKIPGTDIPVVSLSVFRSQYIGIQARREQYLPSRPTEDFAVVEFVEEALPDSR